MSPGRAQLFNSVDYNDVATAVATQRPLAPPGSQGDCAGAHALTPAITDWPKLLQFPPSLPAKINAETWNQSFITPRHNSSIKIIRVLLSRKLCRG